jgi:hypothetical protein
MSAPDISGCVLVPLDRLRHLEALEAKVSEQRNQRLSALREKEKADPEPHKKKVLENYHKNKDEVNKRRREAYKLKKEIETKATEPTT